MFVQSLRQSSCSQSNNWCSNFQTCDLNQRCWRMTMNHAIKLPSKTLLSEETHSTIKLSKIKTATPLKTVTSSFGFIICDQQSWDLSSAIYWFWVFFFPFFLLRQGLALNYEAQACLELSAILLSLAAEGKGYKPALVTTSGFHISFDPVSPCQTIVQMTSAYLF